MDKLYPLIRFLLRTYHTVRASLHLWLLRRTPAKNVILKDVKRWIEITQDSEDPLCQGWNEFVWLLRRYPEFRNLFYRRLRCDRSLSTRLFSRLASRIYKPLDSLFILADDIGPGFFIQHGFSTIIAAKSIGENCWINQQVTVGYKGQDRCPTIGDNVHVCAGAIILGDVYVGANTIIGANSVVVKDVPPNCTVVGVPAKVIKQNGKKVIERIPEYA